MGPDNLVWPTWVDTINSFMDPSLLDEAQLHKIVY